MITAFSELGLFLRQFGTKGSVNTSFKGLNDEFYDRFQDLVKIQCQYNGWFTEDNVRHAIASISVSLTREKLEKWLLKYESEIKKNKTCRKIGVIMAGNIPLVGFHDFLCVLTSGNIFIGKTSSNDKFLLPFVAEILISIEPAFKDLIFFTDNQVKNADAIIATGSNNSSRYFDYYFGKYPHVIRKSRNSVAVLNGTETARDLKNLGKDIFQYFGLGCRNVSKLFVPEGYDFDPFFKAIYEYKNVINNNKYGNNYDYNKVVYLMNKIKLIENGFLVLKEDTGLASPVAVLYYEYYPDKKTVSERLKANDHNIQCIVSGNKEIEGVIGFGKTQYPGLWDYADGVDTMRFLFAKKSA